MREGQFILAVNHQPLRDNRPFYASMEGLGGKIGYLHIPNMMGEGLIAFNTWFYP